MRSLRGFLGACSLTAAMVASPGLRAEANATVDTRHVPMKLWYDEPAEIWMTEALPIGNGPMGAMLFGGTDLERIQFNEISLWSGDRVAPKGSLLGETLEEEEQNLGAHQAFGDIFIQLGHEPEKVTGYRRELDLDRGVHTVSYDYEGVHYTQTAFGNHPSGVLVVQLSADKAGSCSGRLWLTDMHDAEISMANHRFTAVGKMPNGFEYEAQLQVLHEGGELKRAKPENNLRIPMPPQGLSFEKCDRITLVLGAGTNFLQDHTKEWLGEHPHQRVSRQVTAAAKKGY
ncbi:MAG: glycoside hydrolase family 95 protein, partial [Verrucomicrobiales bacterium]